MTIVANIVRLRWALTFAAMRKSVWQTVGYIILLVFGVCGVAGVAVSAFFLGIGPDLTGLDGLGAIQSVNTFATLTQVGVVATGACLTLITVVVQLLLIGEGSTLSAKRFELYGIEDRTLQFGLLAAGMSGAPALGGIAAMALWSMAYRWMGLAPVLVSVVAAPLAVITILSISRMVISLATSLVTSSRGRAIFYMVSIVLFIVMCQVPSVMVNSNVDADGGFDVSGLMAGGALTADILAWTPLGAAFQLPFDAFVGAWLPMAGRLAVLAVTWVVCFLVCTWCLRHERLVAGRETATTVKGIGAFAWMPDSPSGAISARLLTLLRRDPRLSMIAVMPLIFVVLFAIQSHGITAMIWQSFTWMGLIMMMCEGNGLAYDGGGFTMQVLAGVRGRDDRAGRVRVYAIFMVAYLLVLMLAVFAFTGDWRTADGLMLGLCCTAIGIGVTFAALGLAQIVSCVLMYPVPSIDKPFSSPQGRLAAQGFFPFAHLFGSIAVMLPTGIVAVVCAFVAPGIALWATAAVAVANGVVALAVGSWLGGKLLDARAVNIVSILDSFASLQK